METLKVVKEKILKWNDVDIAYNGIAYEVELP